MLRAVDLAAQFNFTPDDLAANQTGILSERQRNLLIQKETSDTLYVTLLVIVMLLIGVFGLAAFTIPFMHANFEVCGLSLYLLIPLNSALLAHAQSIRRIGRDLRTQEIAQTEGLAEIIVKNSLTRRQYTLEVDSVRFSISVEQAQCFRADERYCIYYTPAAEIILSAELLTDAP